MRVDKRIADDRIQARRAEHGDILRLPDLVRNIIDRGGLLGRLLLFLLFLLFLARSLILRRALIRSKDFFAERLKILIFAAEIFEDDDVLHFGIEVLILQAADFDKERQIRPALDILLPVRLIQPRQFVGDLFDDMFGDLLHLPIVLQKAARDVERDVGAVDDAVQEQQIFGDDFLYIVRDKDLIAVQLDFSALKFDFALDFREIQYPLEPERIIHIQMDPEQRVMIIMENFSVESEILLLGAVFRVLQIERLRVVDGLFVLFPLCIEIDLIRHEGTVLFKQAAHRALLEKLLLFLCNVHHDLRAAAGIVALLDRVCALPVGLPVHGGNAVLIGLREDLNILRDHIRRIEPQPEVSDDSLTARLLVF